MQYTLYIPITRSYKVFSKKVKLNLSTNSVHQFRILMLSCWTGKLQWSILKKTLPTTCTWEYVHEDENYETKIVLNSNLIIPDFPHSMKIRLAPLKMRQPTGHRLYNVRMQGLFFNGANLISILWGKSGFIKFEFKHTLVSLCSS